MRVGINIGLLLFVLVLSFAVSGSAQMSKAIGGTDWKKMADAARKGDARIDFEAIARIDRAFSEKPVDLTASGRGNLTGTWYVTVPGATPADNFYAYQTFGADGTFVETSSLLASLTEGPAHGVWERRQRGFVLTFELFAFDPESRAAVGRVRVRGYLRTLGNDELHAETAVDFIEPDGTIIPNIATGPFSGQRVQIRPLSF